MANEEKRYSAGDKATVTGTVVRVGDNAGRTEYVIAVEDKDAEYDRPLNIAQTPDPVVFTNGHAEFQKEMLSRSSVREDDETPALSKDADEVREETDTPDPRKRAAGNANTEVKPGAPKATSTNK